MRVPVEVIDPVSVVPVPIDTGAGGVYDHPPPPPEETGAETVTVRVTILLVFPAVSTFQYWSA